MAQTLTLARPARNLRPYLWLALPLLVLATLFFYPLLLIAEQALRDASGNLSLETFWQVIDSKRFIGALLNTLQIAVFATLGCRCSAASRADSGVYSVSRQPTGEPGH